MSKPNPVGAGSAREDALPSTTSSKLCTAHPDAFAGRARSHNHRFLHGFMPGATYVQACPCGSGPHSMSKPDPVGAGSAREDVLPITTFSKLCIAHPDAFAGRAPSHNHWFLHGFLPGATYVQASPCESGPHSMSRPNPVGAGSAREDALPITTSSKLCIGYPDAFAGRARSHNHRFLHGFMPGATYVQA